MSLELRHYLDLVLKIEVIAGYGVVLIAEGVLVLLAE